MRLSLIEDNPLRMLGVFANATMREMEQNKTQLQVFAHVGQELQLPLWLNGLSMLQPLPVVTEEMLTQAQAQLTLQEERDRYALFWFERDAEHEQEDLDTIVLLNENRLEEVKRCWWQRTDHAAQKNLLLLAVLADDWPEIGKRAVRCFADDIAGFRLFMAEVVKESDDANSPLSFMLLDHFETEPWKKELERQLEDNHKRVLDKLIADVKQIDSVSLSLMYKELGEAISKTDHVDSLKNLKGEKSIVYAYYANETAKGLLKAIHLCVCKYGEIAEWAAPFVKRLWAYVNENDPEYNILQNMMKHVVYWTKWNKTADHIIYSFGKVTPLESKDDDGCLVLFMKLLVVFLLLFILGKACGPLIRPGKEKTDRFQYQYERIQIPEPSQYPWQMDSVTIQQHIEELEMMINNENNANF